MRSTPGIMKIWMLAMTIALGLSAVCLADEPLGITPRQKDQLKSLAMDTRHKTMHEREALKHARMDLFQAYSSYDADERKAKAAMDRISTAQRNLLNIHLDNEIAIRSILTADQFNALRDRMMKRMHHPSMAVIPPAEEAILERFPDKAMLDSIELTPDQDKRLMKALKPGSNMKRTIDNLRNNSKQMLDLYSSYDLDTAAAKKLIDSIHQSQVRMLTMQRGRQQAIRSVLTPDQFERLKQEIQKKLAERKQSHDERM